MTPQQAREQIGFALKRAAPGSDVDAIDPDAELRDALDLDSLDFLQFVEILSEISGRRIDEDEYLELATLNSSIRFLAARLPSGRQDGTATRGVLVVHRGQADPATSGFAGRGAGREAGMAGHGRDDMGDDEQETELAEYKQYIEDPPDDLVIAEDNDDDAVEATDWAALHPRKVRAEQERSQPDRQEQQAEADDVGAEDAAMHKTREP